MRHKSICATFPCAALRTTLMAKRKARKKTAKKAPAKKKQAKKTSAQPITARGKAPENRARSGRKSDGRFEKGVSGNPGGRPKDLSRFRELARAHTEAAINALVGIMNNKRAPSAARVSAACALLDRGYGRPRQAMELSGPASEPLPVCITSDMSPEEASRIYRERVRAIRPQKS